MVRASRFLPLASLPEPARARLVGQRLDGLHLWGSCEGLEAPTVAVVGTRAPSDAGRRLARTLASELAAAGVCIVSGLALGIDTAAHRGALDAGAPTVGVLGGGLWHFYPRANRALAEEIVAGGGGVASPFADPVPARPAQFLQRNAVIAGLADAVVVVEAALRSGALNTAAWAADASKPVMAFPGDVDRPKVAGCLALIHDGALLVRDAADVLAALPSYVAPVRARRRRTGGVAAAASELERRVIEALGDGERGLDALCAALDEPPARLLAALGALELAGAISRRDGTRFALG